MFITSGHILFSSELFLFSFICIIKFLAYAFGSSSLFIIISILRDFPDLIVPFLLIKQVDQAVAKEPSVQILSNTSGTPISVLVIFLGQKLNLALKMGMACNYVALYICFVVQRHGYFGNCQSKINHHAWFMCLFLK